MKIFSPMKRLFYLLPALALLVVSCARESGNDAPEIIEITSLTASCAPETKTQIVGETHVYWAPYEDIQVYSTAGSGIFTSQNEQPVAVAEFVGSIPQSTSDSRVWAYYPAENVLDFDDGVFSVVFPPIQAPRAGTFNNRCWPAMGQSGSLQVPFYSVCGGLCFSVTHEQITQVMLFANRQETIFGKAEVKMNDQHRPEVLNLREGGSNILFAGEEMIVPGEKYFIVLPPITLESGFSLVFERIDPETGKLAHAVRSIDKSVTFQRGVFSRLLLADEGLEFKVEENPVLECVSVAEDETAEAKTYVYYPMGFPTSGNNRKDGTDAEGVSSEWAVRSATAKTMEAPVTLEFTLTDSSEDLFSLTANACTLLEYSSNTGMNPVIQSFTVIEDNRFLIDFKLGSNWSGNGAVQLQLTLPSGRVVVSNPVYLTRTEQNLDLRIAEKGAHANYNYHYRRAIAGINNLDDEALKPAVDGTTLLSTRSVTYDGAPSYRFSSCDAKVLYDATLDLMDLVRVHDESGDASHTLLYNDDLQRLGFKWQFEVVHGYQAGDNIPVMQENFVSLSTTNPVTPEASVIFTPRAYGYNDTKAAIGRTPVIRVSLLKDNDILECAYIKVYIGDTEEGPGEPVEVNAQVNYKFMTSFSCSPSTRTCSLTLKQMSDDFYVPANLSAADFHQQFVFDPNYKAGEEASQTPPDGQYGRIVEVSSGDATVLMWEIGIDDIWRVATASQYIGQMTRTVYYRRDNSVFTITFTSTVPQFSKKWDLMIDGHGQYISGYWFDDRGERDDINFGHTRFTASVPMMGETNPGYCLFENNLNAPFKTDEAGRTIFSYSPGFACSGLSFNFHSANNNLIHGGIKLVVNESDPTRLYAKKGAVTELVARIYNGGYTCHDYDGTIYPNTIVLEKTSTLAKELLNIGFDAFKVYIGADATICNDATKKINIQFNGKDYFEGRFIRPVSFETILADYFVDGADYGDTHSYIALSDIVRPLDWRNRQFPAPGNNASTYGYYWDYYGIGSIGLIDGSIKTNLYHLNSDSGVDALPTTMRVYISQDKNGTSRVTEGAWNDYLIYRNNGSMMSEFKLFIMLSINYTWGTFITDEIVIPVKPFF